MIRLRQIALFLLCALSLCPALRGECISFSDALKHVGEYKCVTGKIYRVQQGAKGTHYLDFCDDYRTCTFTVVIFRGNLRHVGDVRQLQDRIVEIHGEVKRYDNRAEIILEDASQLGGESARLPRLPKDYDVEQKGHYSAGTFSQPHTTSTTTKKRQPATVPAEIPEDTSE